MNVLIIADKSNGKIYTEIINKAPNTKVIGIINSISDSFISDLGNKYTPNVVILDTAVENNNNNFPAVTQAIGRTYSFVKSIVLAEANDNRDFPSAAYVVRGSISSKNIIDMLSDINRKCNTPHDDIDGSAPTENLQSKVFQRQAPPNLDVKVKKVKQKKQKTRRKNFKFNPLYLLPVVVLVVIITICVCIKAYNGNHSQKDVSDNSITGTSAEITTDVPATTQYYATIATVAEYSEYSNYNNSEPDTVPYSPKSVDTETSKIESNHNDGKSSNGNDKSSSSNQSNNSGSKSNNNNNSNNSGGSHSYVTVSKTEYNYSHNKKTDIEVSGITLNYLSKTLTAGESINLSATVTPSNATDTSISWSTSNSSVATVSNGYVVSHSAGSAYITATAGNHSATCTVVVKEKETQDSVYITPAEKYCNINEVITFTLINANNCSFNISNPSAVQIIGGGTNRIQIKAKSRTTVTITATNNSTGREYTAKLIIE